MECASQCSSYDFCKTASFDSETTSCNLSSSCNPETLVLPTATFIRKRSKREFKPIFVACSGNGQSVLDTWRTPSMGREIVNINDSCKAGHLRSSIIDHWNGSIIDQVKVELFSNGKLGVEIYFDGHLSTNSNWFSMERLCYSSFNDLTHTSISNIFSMDGDQTVDRHFYISSSYGGCSEDTIWMVVIDTANANYRPCFYDKLTERECPYILYGPDQHTVKLNDGTYAVADKMVISI
ncbi:uncharacterized protein LOC143074729 [Mytilus galloprovincialis]|uniref:uncharacterized protein LOC143074729 n=1 Tax=Mytilus galloprovincialis TaxID=29158 RepID=UPI003F7B6DBA